MTKRILSTVMLIGALSAGTTAFAQEATLSKKEQKAGWKLLFDGKTTNGWRGYKTQEAPGAWKVENGALFLDTDAKKAGAKGGDIMTAEPYENYELELEWKISEGGNSGIIFSVHEDPKFGATYQTGPEMQVLDDDKHSDGKIHKHNSGDLYDLIAAPARYAKPVGQWNTAKIIKKDGKLTLVFNGHKTAEVTMGSEAWDKLVAGSKFKAWDGFGKFQKGHIALQDHGDKVWYRNIKIRQL
ncbi:3-keto-disaccharide hydrolase [Chitinophaga sp. NPDC101104]|uniref:3-keto-disaccharide hydrolase n=1 Tax=Chitinophaga sp. NPDC101104 TaxID=3390561 RepID=UPI003D005366